MEKNKNFIKIADTSFKQFLSWKGKITKFEYLEKEKSFLDEMKNIFHSFSFGDKIKIC